MSIMSSKALRTLAAAVAIGALSTNAFLSETHRTWNRPEAAELAQLYGLAAPNYVAVMESYRRALDVIKQTK